MASARARGAGGAARGTEAGVRPQPGGALGSGTRRFLPLWGRSAVFLPYIATGGQEGVCGMTPSRNIMPCFIQQHLSSQRNTSSSALCKKGETCRQGFLGLGLGLHHSGSLYRGFFVLG